MNCYSQFAVFGMDIAERPPVTTSFASSLISRHSPSPCCVAYQSREIVAAFRKLLPPTFRCSTSTTMAATSITTTTIATTKKPP